MRAGTTMKHARTPHKIQGTAATGARKRNGSVPSHSSTTLVRRLPPAEVADDDFVISMGAQIVQIQIRASSAGFACSPYGRHAVADHPVESRDVSSARGF